jgi:hypothetical protein
MESGDITRGTGVWGGPLQTVSMDPAPLTTTDSAVPPPPFEQDEAPAPPVIHPDKSLPCVAGVIPPTATWRQQSLAGVGSQLGPAGSSGQGSV